MTEKLRGANRPTILRWLLPIAAVLLLVAVIVSPVAAENSCGESVSYMLENGVLTISGTGAMNDYNGNDVPWYNNRKDISRIVIGEGITYIGKKTFWGFGDANYNNVVSLTVPSTLERVDKFWISLGGLTSVNVGTPTSQDAETSVMVTDNILFLGNTLLLSANKGMTSYEIPSTVETIGDFAFYNHTSLTNVKLSESTKNYGDYAFIDCSALKTVNFDAYKGNVVPTGFFYGTAIETAQLPANINEIGTSSFFNCKELTSVDLSGVNQKIGTNAFAGCSNLETITLTKKIAEGKENDFFGLGCFSGTAITSITLPENAVQISENMFQKCTSLQDVVSTSGSLTSIGKNAFFLTEPTATTPCAQFTGMSLNLKNVQTIGENAFRGTAMESIRLNSISTVGNNGINTASLKVLDMSGVTSAPTFGTDVFSTSAKKGLVIIYVSDGSFATGITTDATTKAYSGNVTIAITNGKALDIVPTGNTKLAKDSKSGYTATWYEYNEEQTNKEQEVTTPVGGKTYIAEWTLDTPTKVTVSANKTNVTSSDFIELKVTVEHDLKEGLTYKYQWYNSSGSKVDSETDVSTITISAPSVTTTYYCKVTAVDSNNVKSSEVQSSNSVTINILETGDEPTNAQKEQLNEKIEAIPEFKDKPIYFVNITLIGDDGKLNHDTPVTFIVSYKDMGFTGDYTKYNFVVFHLNETSGVVEQVKTFNKLDDGLEITSKVSPFAISYSPQPEDKQSENSGSSGSSVWLTETQTPTETPTPTENPTDTVPTDIPITQPTETPSTPGFGVLAVLAGLGAVAVLRRK